jgi:S1-C subfamily serine protease
VQLFERSTFSVANIFDVTLRPQANMTGSVEVPEGNGSGIVWDTDGHIVTNYHGEAGGAARVWLSLCCQHVSHADTLRGRACVMNAA